MDSFHRLDEEAFEYNLRCRGVPVTVRCRVLEYGFTDRKEPRFHEHPDPPFARLFFFHSGGAEIKLYSSGKRIALEAGTAYLLPPGMSFDVHYAVSQLIYFHLDICDATGRAVFAGLTEPPAIRDSALAEKMRRGCFDGDRFTALAGVTDALSVWLRPHWDGLTAAAELANRFARMFEYLDRTPPALVSIKELAELYGITPNALSKRFRQCMGVPLKHYLLTRQLLRAQELLLHSDRRIGEIAAMLGYGDAQYFQRFFKAKFGMTPGEYRRRGAER